MSGNQWYTNKELFEQLNGMQKDFTDLRHEMKETRTIIKQYNGLREELAKVKSKVNNMESIQEGKDSLSNKIHKWGGWIFALVTLVILLINQF